MSAVETFSTRKNKRASNFFAWFKNMLAMLQRLEHLLSYRNRACWEKNKRTENSEKLFGSTDSCKKQMNIWLFIPPSLLSPPFLLMALASFERNLQNFISQPVTIQAVDRHGGLLIVCHGDKAEAFALVGVEISDHFDVDDGTERSKHLPQDGLICILTQVIDEDAPPAGRIPRDASTVAAHVVNTHWRKPRHKEK